MCVTLTHIFFVQMTVFKYVEDKDVFQKFYSKMLAKRLVNATSASDDAETSMISKLKEACGFEYVSKLQKMFQDIGTSKDLNDNFKWVYSLVEEERKTLIHNVLESKWNRHMTRPSSWISAF